MYKYQKEIPKLMQKRTITTFLILLLLVPTITATTGHMKLLAVTDPTSEQGGIADLYLTIKEGNGKVYLDTFPLTKLDTQMSTRFAKEIACDFLEKDCEQIDFFYTIRSNSAIVGGPSAGAAIAVLTVTLLEEIQIDEKTTITGTINSGGIIGSVGGIKAKINAASKKGLTKVLIPSSSSLTENNETLNLTEYSINHSIEIIKVSNLKQALYEFTGKNYETEKKELVIDLIYQQTMQDISETLCTKTQTLLAQVNKTGTTNNSKFQEAINLTQSAEKAKNNSAYYPAASYCFGANIKLRSILTDRLPRNKLIADLNNLKHELSEFENQVDKREINTITDLQTKIIVKERLLDAKNHLTDGFKEAHKEGKTASNLAYATERFFSAIVWSEFFDKGEQKKYLKSTQIKDSCLNKLSEAEERYQYVKLITHYPLENTRKELNHAYQDLEKREYELCLFKASKAKAELDVTLSAMNIKEDDVPNLIDEKLNAAKEQIIQESEKGRFPILGYSYYLYSKDLKENNPISSLVYAEQALELSNIWLYFKERKLYKEPSIDLEKLQIFLSGILIGILIMLGPILHQKFKNIPKTRNSKRKTSSKRKS